LGDADWPIGRRKYRKYRKWPMGRLGAVITVIRSMADYRDWAGRRPRPRAARVPAAVAIVAIDRAHQWQCAPVGARGSWRWVYGSTVRGCTPVPYVQLTVKLTDERCGCRALTALDRRSALSIRTAVCAQESGHAAPDARSIRTEPNKLRSPGSRPTYTETATRCTYATRGSAVMSRDTGAPTKSPSSVQERCPRAHDPN